jgi:catechol 2,3-dioxygenase-like lactoylglutathione lyase family enzyme
VKLHHIGVVCRSQENADRFYRKILGLAKIKASLLSEDLAEAIFHVAQRCTVITYGNENMLVEVFVPETPAENRTPFAHLCLELEDREEFIQKCRDMALTVNRIKKGDSMLVFVADYDGNLFEVKERAG